MTADSPAVATTHALAASYRRRRCLHEADALDGTLAEYDQLRAQLAAVLALHQREVTTYYGGRQADTCSECFESDMTGGLEWPCPTVQALGVTS